MLKIIFADLAGIISFALSALLSVLVSKLLEKKKYPLWATLFCVLAIALVFFTASSFIRVSLETEFQKEIDGVWIETYTRGGDQNYAIAYIRFDYKTRQIDFYGNSYTPDGKRIGEWTTRKVIAVPSEHRIYYFYEGELLKPPSDFPDERYSVIGTGDIKFNLNKPILTCGQGAFREFDTGLPPVNFELNRITENMCKKLTGKIKLEDHQDYNNFIVAYHKEFHSKKNKEKEKRRNSR